MGSVEKGINLWQNLKLYKVAARNLSEPAFEALRTPVLRVLKNMVKSATTKGSKEAERYADVGELQKLSMKLFSGDTTLQKKYFDAALEVVNYRLEFESTRDMFRYIKHSGVSGSRKVLGYKQTKQLMRDYPVNYLEFEVAFIYSR